MKVAAIVRGTGWSLSALTLAVGAFGVLDSEGDDALFIVRIVAITLAVVIGVSHAISWYIEKHAERVVVR